MLECEERDKLYRQIDETQRELYSLNDFMDGQNRAAGQKLRNRIERLYSAPGEPLRKASLPRWPARLGRS